MSIHAFFLFKQGSIGKVKECQRLKDEEKMEVNLLISYAG